jgi:hypothetical protein
MIEALRRSDDCRGVIRTRPERVHGIGSPGRAARESHEPLVENDLSRGWPSVEARLLSAPRQTEFVHGFVPRRQAKRSTHPFSPLAQVGPEANCDVTNAPTLAVLEADRLPGARSTTSRAADATNTIPARGPGSGWTQGRPENSFPGLSARRWIAVLCLLPMAAPGGGAQGLHALHPQGGDERPRRTNCWISPKQPFGVGDHRIPFSITTQEAAGLLSFR